MAEVRSAAGRDYGETLWTSDQSSIETARITGFARWLAERHSLNLDGYHALWQWSVDEPGPFWSAVWNYFGVLGQRGDVPILGHGPMPETDWFPGSTLNYARNALATAVTDPGRTAVIYRSEAGHRGTLSYGQLDLEVARIRAALHDLGVRTGDRVAGHQANRGLRLTQGVS